MIGNVDLDLLEKTYQNANMGITAIEEVIDKVSDNKLQQDLQSQLMDYQEIANKARSQLIQQGAKLKDKSFYDKAMLVGNIKMNHMMEPTDSRIAEMVLKGSTMGVTQMTKLINDKVGADGDSMAIAKAFVEKEESNIEKMKPYL